MKQLLISSILCLPFFLNAQLLRATLGEEGMISIDTFSSTATVESRSSFEQLDGFPKRFAAEPFKNFRNLALADLDGDGADEIIVGISNKLYVFSAKGLLWEKRLSGTATYPPSVADVDGDGELEIAIGTRNFLGDGRLYLVTKNGDDFSNNWPVSFNNNSVLSSPVLSDVDGDGKMEIVTADLDSPAGNVHLLNLEGQTFNENWPQRLANVPAVTPSVGDIDGDGENEIVIFSTRAQYVFKLNGNTLNGYPVSVEGLKYSYQSPILVDLDDDGKLDIIGASHGDRPEYFARNDRGSYLEGWPQLVPTGSWTFSTPSLLETEGTQQIFMSRPIGENSADMLYAWNERAVLSDQFPIVKTGGLEGMISIADVDGDDAPELVFGSNLFDPISGTSFLHAYELDGSGEVDGFPIRPGGWTFMNGATIGDVNGDGMMDAVLLTYTQFGENPDSTFIHAYNLNVPYSPERVWWGTYKGSNSRDGNFGSVLSNVKQATTASKLHIFPNPTSNILNLALEETQLRIQKIALYNLLGQVERSFDRQDRSLNLEGITSGVYFLVIETKEGKKWSQKVMVSP